MTYEATEISTQDGAPVALYEFMWGSTFWRYTNADQAQTITQDAASVTYEPIAISDDGVKQGGSANNDMTVRAPINIPLVDLFRGTPPADSIWLTIRRRHADGGATEFFVHWIGTIRNVQKGKQAQATIIGQALLASFNRSGLRLAWTRSCPHMLYDTECRVDPATFAHVAEITAIGTDGTITVDSAGGNVAPYFDGGYFTWEANADGTIDQRGIEESVTDTQFRIFGSTDRLEVGLSITMYPGCDLSATTCNSKFSNLANFGGFEQMTGENPFDGRNIF